MLELVGERSLHGFFKVCAKSWNHPRGIAADRMFNAER
jgi:hypothetical protein